MLRYESLTNVFIQNLIVMYHIFLELETCLFFLLLVLVLDVLCVTVCVRVSSSLLVLVADPVALEDTVIIGVLLLVKSMGTVMVGEPSSDTVRDHLVNNQPRPAPRPDTEALVNVIFVE